MQDHLNSRIRRLTDTLEALLAEAKQHAQTEVAVGGLVEVLQSPHVSTFGLQPLSITYSH